MQMLESDHQSFRGKARPGEESTLRRPAAIALCVIGRYIPPQLLSWRPLGQGAWESKMRAEVERLVEEIKQSVGLLRRHL
jgi:hypothetical protein